MVRRIKAKLVLRLRAEGLTGRQIAAQGVSRHSVSAVLEEPSDCFANLVGEPV